MEGGLIVCNAIQSISVLNQNVVKSVRGVLELIKTLINIHSVTKDGGVRGKGGRVDPWFNMLAILPGDRCDFLRSHVINEFPVARGGLEELDMFEGGGSEERDVFGVEKLMGETDAKAFEHSSQEVGIGQWGGTFNGSNFGHGTENITGKIHGFAS